jgi:hypothetical protein
MMRAVILVFLILTALCGAVRGQSADPAPTCVEAKGPNSSYENEDRAVFEFSLGASQYTVTANGRGSRQGHSSEPQRSILKVNKTEYIYSRVFACQIGNDLFIAAQVTTRDGELGGGYFYRLEGTSLVMKWRQDIPAFNLANPVLEGATAYVSGIGFIGAINLVSGKYRWRYSGFYEGGQRYNAFHPAVVQDDVVLFQEESKAGNYEIAVRKQTGEILRPSDLKERVKMPESRKK